MSSVGYIRSFLRGRQKLSKVSRKNLGKISPLKSTSSFWGFSDRYPLAPLSSASIGSSRSASCFASLLVVSHERQPIAMELRVGLSQEGEVKVGGQC